jgi:hypothetical protein
LRSIDFGPSSFCIYILHRHPDGITLANIDENERNESLLSTMNATESPTTYEICPSCSQRTASEYFRTVKKTRICNLCAQRADDSDASVRAQIEDHRYHGGLGWLWKFIAGVAAATIAGMVVRYFLISFLRRNM